MIRRRALPAAFNASRGCEQQDRPSRWPSVGGARGAFDEFHDAQNRRSQANKERRKNNRKTTKDKKDIRVRLPLAVAADNSSCVQTHKSAGPTPSRSRTSLSVVGRFLWASRVWHRLSCACCAGAPGSVLRAPWCRASEVRSSFCFLKRCMPRWEVERSVFWWGVECACD